MEAISDILQPYRETVASVTSVVSILNMFSGAVLCFDIYKMKTTSGISAMPFIGGTTIGILGIKYALMVQDKPMYDVNVAAITFNLIYTTCYLVYSQNKWRDVYKPLLMASAIVTVLFTYASLEDESKVEFRYGLIITILMLILIGSPLIEIKDILRKKDASSIPFPIVFMGFIVSLLWLLYGLILLNDFIIIQNIIGTLLCLVQLVLSFKYPSKKKLRAD